MCLAMRKLLAALLVLFPALAVAGGGFLSGAEDVPLPPPLTEAPSGGMLFDSPQGRIVDANASGDLAEAQVIAFYAQTLPQLGWTRISDTEYRSETETLRLTLRPAKKSGLTVHYNLTPNH